MAWTRQEDSAIVEGVQKYGLNNWSQVASLLQNRTAIQCRSRFHQALNQQAAWTDKHDQMLLARYRLYPNQWSTIASVINKTPAVAKQRYLELTGAHSAGQPTAQPDAAAEKMTDEILGELGIDDSFEARTADGANMGRKYQRQTRERAEAEARSEAQLGAYEQGNGLLPPLSGARSMGPVAEPSAVAPGAGSAISVNAFSATRTPQIPAPVAKPRPTYSVPYTAEQKQALLDRLKSIGGPRMPVMKKPLATLDQLLRELSQPLSMGSPSAGSSSVRVTQPIPAAVPPPPGPGSALFSTRSAATGVTGAPPARLSLKEKFAARAAAAKAAAANRGAAAGVPATAPAVAAAPSASPAAAPVAAPTPRLTSAPRAPAPVVTHTTPTPGANPLPPPPPRARSPAVGPGLPQAPAVRAQPPIPAPSRAAAPSVTLHPAQPPPKRPIEQAQGAQDQPAKRPNPEPNTGIDKSLLDRCLSKITRNEDLTPAEAEAAAAAGVPGAPSVSHTAPPPPPPAAPALAAAAPAQTSAPAPPPAQPPAQAPPTAAPAPAPAAPASAPAAAPAPAPPAPAPNAPSAAAPEIIDATSKPRTPAPAKPPKKKKARMSLPSYEEFSGLFEL